jgi:ATP-dependent exoDNAse (exonuclease V) beta subunit
VPLDAAVEQVARLAAVQARMLRSSDEERAAAAAMVDRALKHPLLDRARAARAAGRSCRREVSLGVVVEGVVVDGQADLLFDDGDHWQVVDFKTDVEITGSEAMYQRQVALYMDAARRATGATAEGTLLRV